MESLIKKEQFNGRYLPFEPVAELPDGSIVSGLNMLRASLFGGWTPRYGSVLVNTTAVGSEVLSLHRYKNPFYGDYYLFAQIGSGFYSLSQSSEPLITEDGEELTTESGELILATTTASPLSQRSTMGSSLYTVGSKPGFSCQIGEDMIYADGEVAPLIYGGEQPRCDGFVVYDGSNSTYIDYTDTVIDDSTDTYATVTAHASTIYLVGVRERASAIHIEIATGNTNAVTAVVKVSLAGTWTNVTATDGTSGTNTHDESGSISWSSGSEQMRVIGGRQLYWYQVGFSGAPTAITITACRVTRAIQPITNKWDGEWRKPIGALFYDASATEYIDKLGSVTDESQSTYMDISSMTTSDYIYIKTQGRVLGFGFVMVEGNVNSDVAKMDLIEHIAADGSWTTCGAFFDSTLVSTSGFGENGFVWIINTYDPAETTFAGDDVPGYWHRISVDVALSATVQLAEIAYATWPDDMPVFRGCIEYMSTATYWGCPLYPNRLVQSDSNRPDFICDIDSRVSPPFGAYDPILNAVTVGNYIVVYKQNSIYIWDGESDIPTVVSTDVGLASTKSVSLISGGDKTLKDDEIRVILMHQARDGVYKLSISSSGYLMTKTSEAIRDYFNPIKGAYIGDEYITNLQSCYEKITDTYRLFLPDSVLAYSVGTNEWLPPWEYPLNQTCGLSCIGPDNEQVMFAGTDGGFVLQLDTVNSDRNSSNDEVAIEHKIKTRPLFVSVENIPAITGLLRKTWVEVAATASVELITNGSMELEDGNWTDYGSPLRNYRTTYTAYDGTYSRKFMSSNNFQYDGIQQTVTGLTVGCSYTLSAYVYTPYGPVKIRVNDGTSNIVNTNKTVPDDVWTKVSETFTATTTSVDVIFCSWNQFILQFIYIDAVSLVQAATETLTYTYNIYTDRQIEAESTVTKPNEPSLESSTKEVLVQRFDHNEENIHCFQAELVSNTIGQKLEPYSVTYQIKQIRTLE